MNEEHEQQQIREVIATWMRATAAGDAEQVLDLMTDDVVFLLPGRPPMRGKEAFARGLLAALGQMRIEGESNIQEVRITGDYAHCWNYLTITMTPLQGGKPKRREGHVLSVFRKEVDGRWRLFRDANLLIEA